MIDGAHRHPEIPNVLHYLSFEVDGNMAGSTPLPIQGVLWKRRDVFKNRWRPRWFVLHPDQHILTYYLLTDQSSSGGSAPQQYVTSRSRRTARTNQAVDSRGGSLEGGGGGDMNTIPFAASPSPSSSTMSSGAGNRRRTFSETSNVSESTLDYDVIPRGTIYLLNATVTANHSLTRPGEELFVLSITDQDSAMQCHLAARTAEARDQWIAQIRAVCQEQQAFLSSQQQQQQQRQQERRREQATPPRNNLRQRGRTGAALAETIAAAGPASLAMSSFEQRQQQQKEEEEEEELQQWKPIPWAQASENVPARLSEEIDEVLQRHLPYVEDENHPDWRFRHINCGIHCSAHKERPMIRSIRKGTSHHPVEYLHVLWDVHRTNEYETNVQTQRFLKKCNPQTALVYQAYFPVWPTSPRDFTVVAQWRLLERKENERALCLVTLSCKEADELQPVDERHVRGTLICGLNFWRIANDGGCVHSRIISYNLNGNIPSQMTNTILEQQATLPRVLDLYLQKKKAEPTLPISEHQMEYESICRALETTNSRPSSSVDSMDRYGSFALSPRGCPKQNFRRQPSIEWEALLLLAPLLLSRIISLVSVRLATFLFPLTTLLALRWIAIQYLLTFMQKLPDELSLKGDVTRGTTCCRFNVDLKGVLRFLANEKEAKNQLGRAGAEILVPHIVVRSLAKAMRQLPELISRRIPLCPRLFSVDIVVHDHKSKGEATRIFNADELSVQDIADSLISKQHPPRSSLFGAILENALGPTCRLWATPDSNHSQVDLDLSVKDCPLVVCISGVRLEKDPKAPSLSVSVNIESTDVDGCREFAEHVQRLIQFPEMLEE